MVQAFEWKRMFLGDHHTLLFLLEVIFRSGFMFLMMVIFFRVSGKTEVKQFNIFDVIIIVGLGSAAGDPMFYEDVPLLHCILVFITVLSLYKFFSKLADKNKKLDKILEGQIRCVMAGDNIIDLKGLKKEGVWYKEFFNALRMANVSQLGQVERVYIEVSGEFSIFFREDENVCPGLPIFPEELQSGIKHIDAAGTYSCVDCGLTKNFEQPAAQPVCDSCKGINWVKASTRKRIT